MRSIHQQRVDRFMVLANQEVPTLPNIPSDDVRILRAKLILEEAMETVKALGVAVFIAGVGISEYPKLEFEIDASCNLIEVVDGCCDIMVVTTGTLTAFGVDDYDVQQAVDENNLAKFGPGGYRICRLLEPPDIQAILERQIRWRA